MSMRVEGSRSAGLGACAISACKDVSKDMLGAYPIGEGVRQGRGRGEAASCSESDKDCNVANRLEADMLGGD